MLLYVMYPYLSFAYVMLHSLTYLSRRTRMSLSPLPPTPNPQPYVCLSPPYPQPPTLNPTRCGSGGWRVEGFVWDERSRQAMCMCMTHKYHAQVQLVPSEVARMSPPPQGRHHHRCLRPKLSLASPSFISRLCLFHLFISFCALRHPKT